MNLAFCVCVESPRGGCLCVIIFQYSHTYFCVQIPDLSLFSAVAVVISIVIALSLSCCRLIFLTSCFIHIVFLFLLSPSLPHSCCGHLKMYVLMLCVSTEHRKHAVGGQLIKFQHTFTQKILFGSHNAVDAADDDNK